MKSAALKINNAAAYCFQVCGPVSRRFSNQAKIRGGLYLPSIIRAIYPLIGIARSVVKTSSDIGRSHIDRYLVLRGFADTILEPLRTDHRGQQIGKNESGYYGSQVNHFTTLNFLARNKECVT
jgi:hypothetical protein